jgi:multimeric flavodoxin WrbA
MLLDAALDGVREAGAEVEKIAVGELSFSACLAYRDCSRSKGVCVLNDDLTPVYPKLRDADHIIVASPIFFLGLPAQLKALIDRCQPFWVIKDELKQSPARPGPPRRGLYLAVSNQDRIREFQPSIASIKAMFITLDVRFFGQVLVGGVDAPGEVAERPEALQRVRDAGRRLITGEPLEEEQQ